MNRWKYDPERMIPITCMNPQQSRKYDKVKSTEGSQEFYPDSYGAAHGARVTDDTGALRSIRNMGKAKNKQAADSPSTSAPPTDVAVAKTGAGRTNKKTKGNVAAKTTEPKWTRKLRDALTKAVELYTSSKGVSWVCVVDDMKITKHHCRKEWMRIVEERKGAEASSSGSGAENSVDEDGGAASSEAKKGNKDTNHKSKVDPVVPKSSSDGVEESGGHSELLMFMRAQSSKLEEISANQTRLENESKNLQQLTAKTQSKVLDMETKLQQQGNSSSSAFHGNASSSDESEHSRSNSPRKRRSRSRGVRRKKRGRGSGIDEDSLVFIQNAARQAERVCALTVENDRLRFMNLMSKK